MWTSLDLFLQLLKKEQPAPVFGSSVARPVKQRLKNANRTSRYSGEANPHYMEEKTCLGVLEPLDSVCFCSLKCRVCCMGGVWGRFVQLTLLRYCFVHSSCNSFYLQYVWIITVNNSCKDLKGNIATSMFLLVNAKKLIKVNGITIMSGTFIQTFGPRSRNSKLLFFYSSLIIRRKNISAS